jgi:esterase/lipase
MTARRPIRQILLATLAGACVLSACANHGSVHVTTSSAAQGSPSTATAAASLPQPGVECAGPDMRATTLWFTSRDGVRLEGAVVGSGPVGAILLPEYPGTYCGWWPYAVHLANQGIHVLLFDYHCQGQSACGPGHNGYIADAAGAVATLKARGARSVALVGASLGGALALAAAGSLDPRAIVDLSGEQDPGKIVAHTHLDGLAFAPRVHTPALFVVARGDLYVTVAAMRAIYHAAASADKRLDVLPKSAGHGWQMLTRPDGAFTTLARRVTAFLKSHGRAGDSSRS